MKHNWTYKKLGELVDVLNGYAFKSSNYVKDGIRVIRIANVQKGKIVDEAPAFYPLSAESELTRYMLHEDDILLSLTGNVGRVGLLPKEMLPAALNQRVACLRIKDDTLMFKFLYQFLNSDYFEQKCIESSRGIAQLNMSTEWLKDYPLPIPSLDEQKAIVAELDGINRLIDLQEEQLREYDRLAQSLFYTTFGDPVSNPKGWEVKKLGEVAEVVGGSTPKTSEEKNWIGTNNWISPAEIKDDDKYISSTERCISDDAASHLQLLPIGTVLLSSRAPIGKLAITRIPMYCNQGFKNIVCGKTLNNEYAYWYMKFNVGRLQEMGVGATFKEVSKTIVSAFSIMLPPLALQQSFAAQIEAIEQQKALVRKSLEETRTLLAARMQYYFE